MAAVDEEAGVGEEEEQRLRSGGGGAAGWVVGCGGGGCEVYLCSRLSQSTQPPLALGRGRAVER